MTPKLTGSSAVTPSAVPTPPTPLEAAAALRSAKEQLHKDIATILEAFTADTGLRVSCIGVVSHPQYLDQAAFLHAVLPPSPSELDPNRPYHYAVSTGIDF